MQIVLERDYLSPLPDSGLDLGGENSSVRLKLCLKISTCSSLEVEDWNLASEL